MRHWTRTLILVAVASFFVGTYLCQAPPVPGGVQTRRRPVGDGNIVLYDGVSGFFIMDSGLGTNDVGGACLWAENGVGGQYALHTPVGINRQIPDANAALHVSDGYVNHALGYVVRTNRIVTVTNFLTSAIQDAIDLADHQGMVIMPAGVYTYDDSVTITGPVQLVGCGMTNTIIDASGVVLADDIFKIGGSRNVLFRDFGVVGNEGGGGTGAMFADENSAAVDITFVRIMCVTPDDQAIFFDSPSSQRIIISHCFFRSCDEGGYVVQIHSNYSLFEGNVFWDCQTTSVILAYGTRVVGNLFENCDGTRVLWLAGTGATAVNNRFNGCAAEGIYANAVHLTLLGNIFWTVTTGILMNGTEGVIVGNTFRVCTRGVDSDAHRAVINGNTFDSCTIGIDVLAATSVCVGNLFDNCGTDISDTSATGAGILYWDGTQLGVSTPAPAGRMHIDTVSATFGDTALTLDQVDQDQSFIDFLGTSAADATKNISTMGINQDSGAGVVAAPDHANWDCTELVKVEINGVSGWIAIYDPN